MTSTVQESIDVAVPIRAAYNQWTQFESFPNFMEGVESVSQVDDTHTHWKIRVAGNEREFDATITEQHPEERVAWKSTEGTRHSGVVTFHRLADDQTRVTVQMEWEPTGLVEKAGSAVGADERRVKGDLKRFKSFIEHRGQETGEWRGDVSRPDDRGFSGGSSGPAGPAGTGGTAAGPAGLRSPSTSTGAPAEGWPSGTDDRRPSGGSF